jgi:SAM-dependent methyltransferase
MNDVELERLLTLFEAGQLSAPLTVARLLLVARDVTEVERWLCARGAAGSGGVSHVLLRLIQHHRCGCESVAALGGFLDQRLAGERAGRADVGAVVGGAVVDGAVEVPVQASAPPQSLGDARLLEQATSEIIEQLRAWGLLGASRRTLQIGCGVGRMQKALARQVRLAAGVDVAPRMVARARARCACLGNTRHEVASGADLQIFPKASFDVVYAVDALPHMLEGGSELVSSTFAEVARVLELGGEFLIFNYCGTSIGEVDAGHVRGLADRHGFEVIAGGERLCHVREGVVLRLKRVDGAGSAA